MRCLPLLLIVCLLPFPVFGEDDDAFVLGEVIVKGERPPDEATQTVEEITAEDIRAAGADTVAEALNLATSTRVDTSPTPLSANGKQEELVSLRGFDPRDVVVLIDGVPVYEPYFRVVDLRQIPTDSIAKIKIIKGPSSVLYGPNGMGGVINIITKKGTGGPHGSVEGSYGEVDAFSGSGQVRGSHDSFSYFLAPRFSKSRGFRISDDFRETRNEDGGVRDNSDFTEFSLAGKLGYHAPLGGVSLSASHTEFDGGVPFSMEAIEPATLWRKVWKKTDVALHGDVAPAPWFYLRGRAFYTRYYNTITTFEDKSMSSVAMDGNAVSTYDNDVAGVVLLPDFVFGDAGTLSLSGIYKYDRADIQDETGGRWYDFGAETYSGGAQYGVRVRWFDITAGAAYHFHRRVRTSGDDLGDDAGTFDATLGVAVTPVDGLSIRLAGARKSSFPDLRSLYGSRGNPGLKPEFSINVDLGVAWKPVDQFGIGVTGFYSDVTDLIGKRDTGNEFTYENIDAAKIAGVETRIDVRFLDGILGGSAGYTYMDTRDERASRSLQSLDFRPRHVVAADARVNLPFGTRLAVQYRFVSVREYERPGAGHVIDDLPEYGLVNARVAHVFAWTSGIPMEAELFVEGKNVLDTYYQTAPERAAAGRMLSGGAAFRF